jgi:hypothetical protein
LTYAQTTLTLVSLMFLNQKVNVIVIITKKNNNNFLTPSSKNDILSFKPVVIIQDYRLSQVNAVSKQKWLEGNFLK